MKTPQPEDPRKSPRYDGDLTIREARARYFEIYGLGEGGYEDRWARVDLLGIVPLVLPNTASRARALRHHDVNHVLSGYNALGREGEIDIAGWKFGSGGCGKYLVAWYINLVFFAFGLMLRPRPLFRAFLRGRGSRNAYSLEIDDGFLDKRLDVVRRELSIDGCTPAADLRTCLLFGCYALLSILALGLLPLLLLLAVSWIF